MLLGAVYHVSWVEGGKESKGAEKKGMAKEKKKARLKWENWRKKDQG